MALVFASAAHGGTSAAVAAGAADGASASVAAPHQRFLADEARRLDARFLMGIGGKSDWEGRREELRREYFEMLGLWPLPARTPLLAQTTGGLEGDAGFRVENVHFQSRPGLYVTGNLYLPKDAGPGAKLPAVLYVCGHSSRGRDGNKVAFQHHGMWFATHGYVCLVIDSLQLGEIAAVHHGTYRYDRWWWQARGYTPAGVECWNGVRALDYLQSRPEVDGERLAVTGISGGGAATFWIAAADDRVRVAVPVSGMSDLEDYVGNKVVNGHCDCMFLINTFQWPWTQIAALVAPRPMLFANSGHDTIFPMDGNDRSRARLERLYRFYTNRTDRLFDIAVVPGDHEDRPELRLMAYRWINRHLKGDDTVVTEPVLSPIEGKRLRVFPAALPTDEINTRIDEVFVPRATLNPPASAARFDTWRAAKLAELRRITLRSIPSAGGAEPVSRIGGSRAQAGAFVGEWGEVPWRYDPGAADDSPRELTLVVLDQDETLGEKPGWWAASGGKGAVLWVAARGHAPAGWQDPAPYYLKRSLPLLGRTADTCRLADVVAAVRQTLRPARGPAPRLTLAGKGKAGVIAAYAALIEERVVGVLAVDPPASHRDGPIFLNVLRVVDIPEAMALLAPRSLTLFSSRPGAFRVTEEIYRVAGGALGLREWAGPAGGASNQAKP